MNETIVICSGGSLDEWALPIIHAGSYIIGVDRGAQFLIDQNIAPHLALGDFDSVSKEQLMVIKSNSKQFLDFDALDKDYTDTQLAVIQAVKRKPAEIHIVGGLGTRFDHTLATVQLLELGLQHHIPMTLYDQHNKIKLIDQSVTVIREHYHYISLIPQSDYVTGITLEGFKYPLTEATLHRGVTIGISNELLASEGLIQLNEGQLLVVQSND